MFTMRILTDILPAQWLCLLFLAAAGYYDLRCRKIPAKLFLLAGAGAACYVLFWQRGHIVSAFAGAAVGGLLFLAARLTRESIGYGDAAAFAVTGLLLGARQNMAMLCISLILSAFYSIGLLLCKKGNRKTAIPFLPCAFAGCAVVALINFL